MNKANRPWRAGSRMWALLACVLVGCGRPSTEQDILGSWESPKTSLTYHFSKEGKWYSKQVLSRLTSSVSGTWKLEGRTLVITPETSELIFDGKPKPSPVPSPERDQIVTLNRSALVLKIGNKDGQENLASFHRVREK